eukprot:maker-scaffold604_size126151-snap-gene-0.34 protein:Tk08221 transcript:maker-scaffold604_size126151-snap-gene-0.34-mRNA-1 annotation:"hypothetical protein"
MPSQQVFTPIVLALVALSAIRAEDFSCMEGKGLYTAKYDTCEGNNVIVHKVELSAPFNRVEKRHVLFTGEKATFCVAGQIKDTGISLEHLQNAVWGGIGGNEAGKVDFCEIHVNACQDIQPACEAGSDVLKPGTDFCMCSDVDVPRNAPGFGINIFWKLLSTKESPTDCEKEFDNDKLVASGKTPVMCIKSPAVLRKPPPA